MSVTIFADAEYCYRLCLTLLHSLWLVPVLAAAAWILERFCSRRTSEWGHLFYAGVIGASLLLIPVTWSLTGRSTTDGTIAGQPQAAAGSMEPKQDITVADQPPAIRNITSIDMPGSTVRNIGVAAGYPARRTQSYATLLRAFGPWLLAGYCCGLLIMVLRLLLGVVQDQRMRRNSVAAAPGPLRDAVSELQQLLRLTTMPVVRVIDEAIAPHVTGLLRPIILLPASVASGLPADQLQLILAHEIAHIVRRDPWILLIQRLAETVLFFNPAIWIVSRRLNTLREECCDDHVCRILDSRDEAPGIRYATALLNVAQLTVTTSPHSSQLTTLAAVSRSPSELRRRIARLLGEPSTAPTPLSRLGLVTLCVTTVLLASLAGPSSATDTQADSIETQAEDPSESKEEEQHKTTPSVQVLAIGTCTESPNQWWDARGDLLKDVPFDMPARHSQIARDDAGSWRRIVIRIDDLPEKAQIKWRIAGANSWGTVPHAREDLPTTSRLLGKWISPADATQPVNMTVGLADGSWKTIAESDSGAPSAQGSRGRSVVFSKAFASGSDTTVIVSHNVFDENFRVVAVDRSDRVHDMVGRGGFSAGSVYQVTARFRNVLPSQIDHVAFQVRPYQWTEFANIPLAALPRVGAEAPEVQQERQRLPVVVAKHVVLLNGNQIVTWEDIEKRLIEMGPEAYPAIYITHSALTSDRWETLKKKFWEFTREHKLNGHSEGTLSARTSLRYDAIQSAADLKSDLAPLITARIKDSKGAPVANADVVLITPIDESISYRGYELPIVRGRVRNPIDHVMVRSDDTGEFAIHAEQKSFLLLVMHPDSGFAMVHAASWKSGQDVRLSPWGQLTTGVNEVPGEVQTVNLTSHIEEQDGLPEISITQYWSDLTSRGAPALAKFLYAHIPPILRATASRSFRGTRGSSTSVPGASVSLLPGERREIDLGPLSKEQKSQIDFMRKQFQSR